MIAHSVDRVLAKADVSDRVGNAISDLCDEEKFIIGPQDNAKIILTSGEEYIALRVSS